MKKIKNRREKSLLTGATRISGLFILALLPLRAFALGPGCQAGTSYTVDKGIQTTLLRLVPEEINLNKDTGVDQVIYETDLPVINYTCYIPDDYTGAGLAPRLQTGNNFITTMQGPLTAAGLKVQLVINGKTWIPGSAGAGEFFPIAPPYVTGGAMSGSVTGKLQLVLTKKIDRPQQVYIQPASDVIDLTYGRKGVNYIALGTANATRVSYIPECIGKTWVPDRIELGRVITGGKGSLPSPRTFNIRSYFDTGCTGFSDIQGWGKFALSLWIEFEATGAQLTPDGEGIILKNDSHEKNGLKLVIKKHGVYPVKFSDWNKHTTAITVSNNPLDIPYTAELQPVIPGNMSSLKKGSFSQQVTVRVRYE